MANEGPSRIREIPPEQLSAPQKAAIEAVIGGRGRIPGPYKIWLHSPILMQRLERQVDAWADDAAEKFCVGRDDIEVNGGA